MQCLSCYLRRGCCFEDLVDGSMHRTFLVECFYVRKNLLQKYVVVWWTLLSIVTDVACDDRNLCSHGLNVVMMYPSYNGSSCRRAE